MYPIKSRIKKYKPFVSVCTPTFNRRPFIINLIKCFNHQDYSKDRMEWIIIDDGTDKIFDLVQHLPNVKYFAYDKKMPLGEKRNLMHEKAKGSILVYMDDDDYYPPTRVSHAVEKLLANPQALCAGSSEIYIYFNHVNKMYQFGPYGPNHATAGTFAFKRELLNDHSYENTAALAEEKAFLKNYTVPFVQLDPLQCILVFSHQHNTFDKKKLLNIYNSFIKESSKTVDMFIKENDIKDFYMNEIESLLLNYPPGNPEMKPDVIKQTLELEERNKQLTEDQNQNQNQNILHIIMQQENLPPKILTNEEILHILQQQKNEIDNLLQQIKGKDLEIDLLSKQLNLYC
jgi:hypothetical protein